MRSPGASGNEKRDMSPVTTRYCSLKFTVTV